MGIDVYHTLVADRSPEDLEVIRAVARQLPSAYYQTGFLARCLLGETQANRWYEQDEEVGMLSSIFPSTQFWVDSWDEYATREEWGFHLHRATPYYGGKEDTRGDMGEELLLSPLPREFIMEGQWGILLDWLEDHHHEHPLLTAMRAEK